MSSLIAEVDEFFLDIERRARDAREVYFEYDSHDRRDDWLGTFEGTDFRRQSDEPIADFIDRRREAYLDNQVGIMRLGPRTLFDFEIELDSSGGRLQTCNCGFYAVLEEEAEAEYPIANPEGTTEALDLKGQPNLTVGLRYEADFENVGRRWVDHPHHHLHWEASPPDHETAATETHIRVPPMLPTHVFEFCARHYFPRIWEFKFGDDAKRLREIAERLNDLPPDRRRQTIGQIRGTAEEHSEAIEKLCTPEASYDWSINSAGTALPL